MRAFWVVFLPALAYQALALVASVNHLLQRSTKRQESAYAPPVSILKPLRGLDPNTFEAFVSQASQAYGEYELLFGVADPNDPVIHEVQRLQQQFPEIEVRVIVGAEPLLNGKAAVLASLAKHARHPVWVVNDSDIKVTPEYLEKVVRPLQDPLVGLVTCLYRAQGHTLPAIWESLGIATDFMPSTLVAQLIGVREFGLGSTLAFRACDLARAGGFEAIGDYLADDYQLAKRITSLGKRTLLSTYVVETSIGDATWKGSWDHQIRWGRTIRASKGGGYAGLPITHAGLWALLALVCGAQSLAAALLGLRLISALVSAALVLTSSQATSLCWLSPVWDLYSFLVWVASYAGHEVRWRDRVMKIDRQGRIRRD